MTARAPIGDTLPADTVILTGHTDEPIAFDGRPIATAERNQRQFGRASWPCIVAAAVASAAASRTTAIAW